MMYPVDHQRRTIAILDTCGMDDDAQRKPFGIDERMDLAPFDFLAGIVAYAAIVAAPFSADLTD